MSKNNVCKAFRWPPCHGGRPHIASFEKKKYFLYNIIVGSTMRTLIMANPESESPFKMAKRFKISTYLRDPGSPNVRG